MFTSPPLEEIAMPPRDLKPARSYIAKPIPVPDRPGKFFAQWASPGLLPDFVYEGDVPAVYDNEQIAEYMALRVMRDALNSRAVHTGKRIDHQKMSGAEFAVGLAEIDITPSLAADLIGSSQERVIAQIDSEPGSDVPFFWRVLLELLKDPENKRRAFEAAAKHITRKPKFVEYLKSIGADPDGEYGGTITPAPRKK